MTMTSDTPTQLNKDNPEVQALLECGDMRTEVNDDGEDVFFLTEQGLLRRENTGLKIALMTALRMHDKELAKWKIQDYLRDIVGELIVKPVSGSMETDDA